VQLQASGAAGRVDVFRKAVKLAPIAVRFIDEHDQVAQVASEAIQTPANHDIVFAPFAFAQHRIEWRASVLAVGDAANHELGCGPASRLAVRSQFDLVSADFDAGIHIGEYIHRDI
jgi:hypothetical protein